MSSVESCPPFKVSYRESKVPLYIGNLSKLVTSVGPPDCLRCLRQVAKLKRHNVFIILLYF